MPESGPCCPIAKAPHLSNRFKFTSQELMVSIFASNALGFGLGPLLSGAIGVTWKYLEGVRTRVQEQQQMGFLVCLVVDTLKLLIRDAFSGSLASLGC